MRPLNYCVIDLEMTGMSVATDKVLEVGAVRVRNGKAVECFGELCNPGMEIPEMIVELTGITQEMVSGCEETDRVLERFADFMGEDIIIGHSLTFDYRFIQQWMIAHGRKWNPDTLDTLKLAKSILPESQPKNLEALCRYYEVSREHAHRALDDARETAEVFERLYESATDEQRQSLFAPGKLQIRIKKKTPATRHQVERLQEFMHQHEIKDEIDWTSLSRSEASRRMDHYRMAYGR